MKDTDLTWFEQAICSGETSLFFPPTGANENRHIRVKRERLAIAICDKCSVKERCKQYARENDELGVWGGETEESRYLAGYLRNSVVSRRRKFAKMYSADVLEQFNERESSSAQQS